MGAISASLRGRPGAGAILPPTPRPGVGNLGTAVVRDAQFSLSRGRATPDHGRSGPAPTAPRTGGPPMLSLLGRSSRLCDGITRREALRVGGLGFTGLMWSHWLRARASAADRGRT